MELSQDLEVVGSPTRPIAGSNEAASGPTARVVRAESKVVHVEADAMTACAACDIHQACTGLRLGANPAPLIVAAENRCDARPGHEVRLRLPAGGLALSAALLYLLPAAALVTGAALGSSAGSHFFGFAPDFGAFAGAVLALLTTLGLLRVFDPRLAGWRRLRLDAVAVVRGEGAE
jgi:positive regulator of sigma E activity